MAQEPHRAFAVEPVEADGRPQTAARRSRANRSADERRETAATS